METSHIRKQHAGLGAARSQDRAARHRLGVREARSADADEEPGDVRAGGCHGAHHRDPGSRSRHGRSKHRIRIPDRAVAVVHGAVRELRRGDRGGPRQGPGRRPAAPAYRNPGEAAAVRRYQVLQAHSGAGTEGRRHRPGRSRRHHSVRRRDHRRRRLGQRSGDHGRICAGHPRSPAATVRRSRAARRCCRTGSRCGSPPRRARRSSIA